MWSLVTSDRRKARLLTDVVMYQNNAPPGAGLGAIVLGFVVVAIGMSNGWVSGYAINPARDIGPRLALWCVGYGKNLWTDFWYWWLLGVRLPFRRPTGADQCADLHHVIRSPLLGRSLAALEGLYFTTSSSSPDPAGTGLPRVVSEGTGRHSQ